MRRILVDHARSRHYQKRGGNAARVTLDEAVVVASEPDQDFVALDDALTRARGGRRQKESGRGNAFLRRAEPG